MTTVSMGSYTVYCAIVCVINTMAGGRLFKFLYLLKFYSRYLKNAC